MNGHGYFPERIMVVKRVRLGDSQYLCPGDVLVLSAKHHCIGYFHKELPYQMYEFERHSPSVNRINGRANPLLTLSQIRKALGLKDDERLKSSAA
jgi:hypothetical protein